jgi:hypothetical protein
MVNMEYFIVRGNREDCFAATGLLRDRAEIISTKEGVALCRSELKVPAIFEKIKKRDERLSLVHGSIILGGAVVEPCKIKLNELR